MSAEAPETAHVTARWDLSDDDDYVDDVQSEEEEPENQLKEEVDKLIARIKELLKGDNFSLELKDVPRYVTRKNIEEFFEIESPERAEVEDPDPKNKRDVTVHFYNADDFCDALRKNGRTILSYTFDACYNPNIHHKLRTRGSLKHRDSHFYHNHSYHHDGQRSEGDYRRDSNREQSGDVRKQRNDDYDRRGRDERKTGGKGYSDRHSNGFRQGRDKDRSGRGGSYTVSRSRVAAPKTNDQRPRYESNNRYRFDDEEEEEWRVCSI